MTESAKVFIVDDEQPARNVLKKLIQESGADVSVIGEAGEVDEAIREIKNNKPDILFLDIQLGDELSFSILEKLNPEDYQIIFVTAYNGYAIQAFQYAAIDYVLKPINPEKLEVAIDKAIGRKQEKSFQQSLSVLMGNMKAEKPKKIVLSTIDYVHVVDIRDIIWCQSSGNYTNFCLKDGKQILISKTLKEFDQSLSTDGFLRVHKSWLINMEHVVGFDRKEGGFAKMSDGSDVPISNTRREEFLALLQSK